LLAKVPLPKEAQQIDRAMEDFAKRYFECNKGLVDNSGEMNIIIMVEDAHVMMILL
jgi:Sec7-like guanine-nucleotide exchange factor